MVISVVFRFPFDVHMHTHEATVINTTTIIAMAFSAVPISQPPKYRNIHSNVSKNNIARNAVIGMLLLSDITFSIFLYVKFYRACVIAIAFHLIHVNQNSGCRENHKHGRNSHRHKPRKLQRFSDEVDTFEHEKSVCAYTQNPSCCYVYGRNGKRGIRTVGLVKGPVMSSSSKSRWFSQFSCQCLEPLLARSHDTQKNKPNALKMTRGSEP